MRARCGGNRYILWTRSVSVRKADSWCVTILVNDRYTFGHRSIRYCMRTHLPSRVISTKAKPHGEILRYAETMQVMESRRMYFLFQCFLCGYPMAGGQDLSTGSRGHTFGVCSDTEQMPSGAANTPAPGANWLKALPSTVYRLHPEKVFARW